MAIEGGALRTDGTTAVVAFARRHPAPLVGLLVFMCTAPLALRYGASYDGVNMKVVAVSLVKHHTAIVVQPTDPFGFNTPYSNYGIGTSLVMAPLYWLGTLFPGDPVRWIHLTSPLLFAATCAVTVEILRRRRYSTRTVVLTTAMVVLGSPLLAYSVTDLSKPGVALMVACIVLALDEITRGRRDAALGAGLAVGGAVLFRTDSILLIAIPVAVAVAVLVRGRRRDLMLFALGGLPAALIWLCYNAARFGSPFTLGYKDQTFSHGLLSGLYGMTLSPGRGIFIYAPIIIAGLCVLLTRRGPELVIGILAAVMLVARIVFYARWWAWFGGDVWGPRFMIPVLPAFVPLVGAALERWRSSRWILAAGAMTMALSLVGVWVTLHPLGNVYRGGVMMPGPADKVMKQVTSPEYRDWTDNRMFDWSLFLFQV